MQPERKFTVTQIAQALRKSEGFLEQAATILRTSRQTVATYVKKYPALQQLVEQLHESHLDMAEETLMSKIKSGDSTLLMFYLRCHGKKRGYQEKSEGGLGENDNENILIVPAEQREAFLSALEKKSKRGVSAVAKAIATEENTATPKEVEKPIVDDDENYGITLKLVKEGDKIERVSL